MTTTIIIMATTTTTTTTTTLTTTMITIITIIISKWSEKTTIMIKVYYRQDVTLRLRYNFEHWLYIEIKN